MIGRRGALALAGAGLAAGRARAAVWPLRPVRIVVPFAAGGSSDICARLVGRQMQAATGQGFVVENIAGGNGVVGTLAVLQAPADAHTLLLGATTTFSVNPYLMRNPGYDADRDFALVGVFGTTSSYLMVAADSPWRTVEELIAAIRAQPGKLNSGWFNGSSRIPAALLKQVARLDFEEVSYKIVGNAITDLQAGQIQFVYIDMVAADAHLASGRFRALAVTGPARSPRYPDLPAMRELFEGFETDGYLGMGIRSATPIPLQVEVNRQIVAAVQDPEVSRRLREMSLEPVAMDLESASVYGRSERAKYGRIMRLARIEPE
ncbi:Bug family tripartite tricarboxylate transporter substrate binding protein [Paracraurococcus lichenis]|uniref:Tripartite tricarboxylate transporter substrate binding protein n=1 Tax=Paracraurococcus lichenis TaxID=3064888 RepID=A0ABT9E012_9PROT|nr:tripartite tricarboxylate transporter substrate binding protein [Paracraurococcus sp. LOR1-02]MDO9709491.1 tripartite tricarboxylate transporter substrate binding protein [Paracraurococcus sp. LOR1-02]